MHDEVTEKDIERMKEEIEYRKLVVRKEALEAVKEARAHGDLSENFEYHAAKKDKNANESRIRYLERMIKTAVVVSDESKSDEVGINNKVTLYFEDDDEEEVYTLVTTMAKQRRIWMPRLLALCRLWRITRTLNFFREQKVAMRLL